MKKRYRISLEEVTGSIDNENIEYVGTWELNGANRWRIGAMLWASIVEAIKGAK
jgi:hypothetical protein